MAQELERLFEESQDASLALQEHLRTGFALRHEGSDDEIGTATAEPFTPGVARTS
jgi:hypothetical protein